MTYKITTDCVGCTLCAKGCPTGAIIGDLKGLHTIDPDKCIDCGYCGKICGVGAVTDNRGNKAVKTSKSKWEKPHIKRHLCAGCSVCVENCPAGCLEIEGPKFHGDIDTVALLARPSACIDCKICAKVCPIDAIDFESQRERKRRLTMNKLFCRTYQAVLKIGMYCIPWGMPETIEGPGSVTKLPALIKSKGYNKVLVVTDKGLMGLGMLDSLFEALKAAEVEYVLYDGVQPNPTDENIAAGVKLFKENGCRAMIAFGGGSSMDCAKGIGAMVVKKGKTVAQLQGLFKVLRKIPTICAVPTTSGTGSETTVAAVITIAKTHYKASMNDTFLMPKYAVLDPQLTMGLPPKITSTTGMDALCHAVESYINHTYNTKLENKLAEDAVKLIHDNLFTAYADGQNAEARQNMQIAAFYAGRAFTRGCVGYVHAIGHSLGGLYGTPHGLAMSVILPHVLRHFGTAVHERLARLAEVCGMEGSNDAEKAEKFITWIEELKAKMEIPVGIDVIEDKDVQQIITWALKDAHPLYPVPVLWDREDFEIVIEKIRRTA